MALHAGKQSLPEPWVMILEVEGRLDGRQVIWGGFGNHVKLDKRWSIADGDEESRCLQHHLLFLIYDLGDILSHPQLSIYRASATNMKGYLASVGYLLSATSKKTII